jgi:integration host factor alpha subunit
MNASNQTVTKNELSEALFDQVGLNKREAKDMIDAFFDRIGESLEVGTEVKISGFGNFQLRNKSARPGRNPKTGEMIPIVALLVSQLPPIPSKRYFTIGEVAELCGVRSHVLRYWEQEFAQLRPQKRRGNRRYYQHHEVILIRKIRALLYEEGFTISGARNRLDEVRGELKLRDELESILHMLSSK